MYQFLINNRDELINRCKAKVARRPKRAASPEQLTHGVPVFLDQLIKTLVAEEGNNSDAGMHISGPAGGDAQALSEIGLTATAHGRDLLALGYSVDQVVHDYGDLCQAITDLAVERDAPFAIDEFRTLNRCLDNAIADAVTSFGAQRDIDVAAASTLHENLRIGGLVHELRNALNAGNLALRAIELGSMPLGGATGSVLKRSMTTMGDLITRSLAGTRLEPQAKAPAFSLAEFIAQAASAAQLEAISAGCTLDVSEVDPALGISGDRHLLLGALANLLNNAFKFTHFHTDVQLKAYAFDRHVLIEVRDRCGGLDQGVAEKLFMPFVQSHRDRSGVGLGLSIAKQSVEANDGILTVTDLPGIGCMFTIRLPRHQLG